MKTAKPKKLKRRATSFKRLPKGPNGGIELLLIHSVEDLGRQGEVVEVKPGFAYNYLLPPGHGTFATDHHKRMVEKHRVKLQELEKAHQADLRKFAGRGCQAEYHHRANATDDGHLYGSVGAPEIVAELKKNGVTLAADQIRLEGVLKELGLYTVKFRLSSEVEGELKVWVVPSTGGEE